MNFGKPVLFLLAIIAEPLVQAEEPWSDTSIAYLYGEYKDPFAIARAAVEDEFTADVFTLEQYAGYRYGQGFFFVDYVDSHQQSVADDLVYLDFSPSLSINALTNLNIGFSPLRELFLSGSWKHKSTDGSNINDFLLGVGAAWNVRGALYFKTHIYRKNNDGRGKNEQLTVVYSFPFKIGELRFLIDGYLGWTTQVEDGNCLTCASYFNFNPQIKLDVGALWAAPHNVYLGVEYDHWRNKFGVKDVDEDNVLLLIKVHF